MKDFFAGNKIRIFFHILVWAILLGIPLYFFKRWDVGKDFIWIYYLGNVFNAIIFYSNYLVLVPKFFFKIPRYKYYLSVLILLTILYFASDQTNEFVFKKVPGRSNTEDTNMKKPGMSEQGHPNHGEEHGRPPLREMHLLNYIGSALFLIFLSIGMRVLERQSQTEKLQKELEKEKLNSELAFLKSQISPHFFFNTLNNIYSLISISAEDSQKAVLKLSKLMRYLLYDSERGDTKLANEIDFMNNYIDLMKLRMNNKISLSVDFPEKYQDINIPPLIFIPFIENAFKHGISYREKSFINISLTTARDSLIFRCINSIVKSGEEKESGHSGIGMENVTKRLNLLFPGKHDLKIIKSDKEFEVILQINFA